MDNALAPAPNRLMNTEEADADNSANNSIHHGNVDDNESPPGTGTGHNQDMNSQPAAGSEAAAEGDDLLLPAGDTDNEDSGNNPPTTDDSHYPVLWTALVLVEDDPNSPAGSRASLLVPFPLPSCFCYLIIQCISKTIQEIGLQM